MWEHPVPEDSVVALTRVPALHNSVRLARRHNAPRVASDGAGSGELARVYLVDEGWRNPSQCGLVVTSEQTGLGQFVDACARSLGVRSDGGTWSVAVPERGTRLKRESTRTAFLASRTGVHAQTGHVCPGCTPRAVASGRFVTAGYQPPRGNVEDFADAPHVLDVAGQVPSPVAACTVSSTMRLHTMTSEHVVAWHCRSWGIARCVDVVDAAAADQVLWDGGFPAWFAVRDGRVIANASAVEGEGASAE